MRRDKEGDGLLLHDHSFIKSMGSTHHMLLFNNKIEIWTSQDHLSIRHVMNKGQQIIYDYNWQTLMNLLPLLDLVQKEYYQT